MKTPKTVETHVGRGGIPLESRYTAGLGGQVFFQALKDGPLPPTLTSDEHASAN